MSVPKQNSMGNVQQAAAELVRLAKEQGLSLTGLGRAVQAAGQERAGDRAGRGDDQHLGYANGEAPGAGGRQYPQRHSTQDSVDRAHRPQANIDVPRDRAGGVRIPVGEAVIALLPMILSPRTRPQFVGPGSVLLVCQERLGRQSSVTVSFDRMPLGSFRYATEGISGRDRAVVSSFAASG
jgi:hypothetical protein